jgi:hypothetical protein
VQDQCSHQRRATQQQQQQQQQQQRSTAAAVIASTATWPVQLHWACACNAGITVLPMLWLILSQQPNRWEARP